MKKMNEDTARFFKMLQTKESRLKIYGTHTVICDKFVFANHTVHFIYGTDLESVKHAPVILLFADSETETNQAEISEIFEQTEANVVIVVSTQFTQTPEAFDPPKWVVK